jgi:predicted sugar kinase
MNEFRPGAAGGGNVGFAFGARTELRVEVSASDAVVHSDGSTWTDQRASLIRHVIERWSDAVRICRQYRVTVDHTNPAHTGLAASAALQLATWASLNHIFGHPYSDPELRRQLARTYREASEQGTQPAFTTGLSSFLGLYGGFAVVGSNLAPTAHVTLPAWSAAMVVPSGLASVSFGAVELKALTSRGPMLDEQHRVAKLSTLFDQLVPAVNAHDLPQIGKAVMALQEVGSKVAEIDIYGDAVRLPLRDLQHEHPCAFMSAVGPGIAVLSHISHDHLQDRLIAAGYDVLWAGVVDDKGILFKPH